MTGNPHGREELSADPTWPTNAELIESVGLLGQIPSPVLDLTYGRGVFWVAWRPKIMLTNDLYQRGTDFKCDWTGQVPDHWVEAFATVVFDPPYKLNGTPTTKSNVDSRYGVDRPATIDERIDTIRAGLRFAVQCVAPDGFLHVKIQNQISSGKYWDLETLVINQVVRPGWSVAAKRILVTKPRPQPGRQINPRNNYSALITFKRKGS